MTSTSEAVSLCDEQDVSPLQRSTASNSTGRSSMASPPEVPASMKVSASLGQGAPLRRSHSPAAHRARARIGLLFGADRR